MRNQRWVVAGVVVGMLMAGWQPVAAAIVEIGPFAGDRSEDLSSFPGGTGGKRTLDIFGDDVTLIAGASGSVKIEFSSERGGDLVVPLSSPVMLGQFDVMEWHFHTPISQFGGYFENNSRFEDILVSMYDVQNNLIGTVVATAPKSAQTWTWNGWQSDTPVYRITTAGNDVEFLHGFVWYDDLEITYASVPEPATGLLLLLAALGSSVMYGRQRSRSRSPA